MKEFMLTDTLENVREFHEKFDGPIAEGPHVPESEDKQLLQAVSDKLMMLRGVLRTQSHVSMNCLRLSLIVEEVAELATALSKRDIKGALDALGDMDYVEKGTVLALGLQDVFYEACQRIHDSNLSKLSNDGLAIKDEAGKIVKGPNYKPVDLSDLVE